MNDSTCSRDLCWLFRHPLHSSCLTSALPVIPILISKTSSANTQQHCSWLHRCRIQHAALTVEHYDHQAWWYSCPCVIRIPPMSMKVEFKESQGKTDLNWAGTTVEGNSLGPSWVSCCALLPAATAQLYTCVAHNAGMFHPKCSLLVTTSMERHRLAEGTSSGKLLSFECKSSLSGWPATHPHDRWQHSTLLY